MRSRLVISVAVGVLAAAGGLFYLGHLCLADTVSFEHPIKISRIAAFSDGGSLNIDLSDANDKHWRIVRAGSLEVDPEKQELSVEWWLGGIPFRCQAPAGSSLEDKVLMSLLWWLSNKLTDEQQERMANGDEETIRAIPGDVVGVWAFTDWLTRRR